MKFKLLPVPVNAEDLPPGWGLYQDGCALGMLGAVAKVTQMPDPARRLRGPEWKILLSWPRPEPAGRGITMYADSDEVWADVDGPGFWGALRQTIRDWAVSMPGELSERLLAEIGPRADAEWLALNPTRKVKP